MASWHHDTVNTGELETLPWRTSLFRWAVADHGRNGPTGWERDVVRTPLKGSTYTGVWSTVSTAQ